MGKGPTNPAQKGVSLRNPGTNERLIRSGHNSTYRIHSTPFIKMPNYEEEQDLSWEKPSWATSTKLKSTGKAHLMKTEGNLAGPITNLPHSNKDGPFSKPEWTGDHKESNVHGDLAKPITNLPHSGGGKNLSFEKPAWTTNAGLKGTGKGDALKNGQEIARPIGGIRPIDDA